MNIKNKYIYFLLYTIVCLLLINKYISFPHQSLPNTKSPIYNQNQRIYQQVSNLLKEMTLEEKVAQLTSIHPGPGRLNVDDNFFKDSEKMNATFNNGVGMVNYIRNATINQTINFRNKLQNYLINRTRLGIPALFLDEAHHGLMSRKSTVFPQSIGLACSWDPVLIEEIYSFIAKEASNRGTNLVLSPVVDVCRDPRWGRVGETLGEDPYLCGILGASMVKGFQGSSDGTIRVNHVGATLKHFAGHGQPEGGLNGGPANYSERVLREFHMEPFRLCIKKSNPACIMASYNEIDGIPSHANKWLLKDILRKEWGYKGVVVSDWFGIDQLWNKDKITEDEKSAALLAFKAGVIVDLPYGVNYQHLIELVNEKKISIRELDYAVSKVLTLKFKLNLFNKHTLNIQTAAKTLRSTESVKLALKAAEKSIVLLKNKNNLLPIKINQFKRIALIGPCANRNYFGDYSGIPVNNVTILDALKNKLGKTCEIVFAQGCELPQNGDLKTSVSRRISNLKSIKEAVEKAKNVEFIIVAIGENEFMCQESYPSHLGDNSTLDLLSEQNELVQELTKLKKPMLVYLMHGRPLAINWIAQNVPAILDGYYMGQETGNAFANILFGKTCPSGKTTITWPRNAGQIPLYYNHKPSAQYLDYITSKSTALFPFGYGLSYTNFAYSNLHISTKTMKKNGFVMVKVDVKNNGKVKGDEIVQMYIHDKISSVTRPVKELKEFKRITLQPGETQTVCFKIDASKLKFWTSKMKYQAEPGEFEVFIGKSSVDYKAITFKLLE